MIKVIDQREKKNQNPSSQSFSNSMFAPSQTYLSICPCYYKNAPPSTTQNNYIMEAHLMMDITKLLCIVDVGKYFHGLGKLKENGLKQN
jgi:hypothetical protein